MGKGGDTTQTTRVEYPPEITDAARRNIDIADEVAAIGYSPYAGPSIAGFSPQQLASMQATDQAASAFGMPSSVNWRQQNGNMAAPQNMSADRMYSLMTGMPPPNTTSAGFSGYSAYPLMQDAISRTPPAQVAAVQSFIMDPVTGAPPTSLSVPRPHTQIYPDPASGRTREERRRIATENALRRAQQSSVTSPVTGQPSGNGASNERRSPMWWQNRSF